MNAAEFIHKWSNYQGNERSGAKPWFADLCLLLGQEEPSTDPDYVYEKGARILGAGSGWADVWKRGHFGWEFKLRGANLDKAYQQLRGYTQDLENPPLLVVSDFDTILIHTNFTNTKHVVHTIKWRGEEDRGPGQRINLSGLVLPSSTPGADFRNTLVDSAAPSRKSSRWWSLPTMKTP